MTVDGKRSGDLESTGRESEFSVAAGSDAALESREHDRRVETIAAGGVRLRASSCFAPRLSVNEYDWGERTKDETGFSTGTDSSADMMAHLPDSGATVLIRPDAAVVLEAAGEPASLNGLVQAAQQRGCEVKPIRVAGLPGRCWADRDGHFWVAFIPHGSKLVQITLLYKPCEDGASIEEIAAGAQFGEILDGISL